MALLNRPETLTREQPNNRGDNEAAHLELSSAKIARGASLICGRDRVFAMDQMRRLTEESLLRPGNGPDICFCVHIVVGQSSMSASEYAFAAIKSATKEG